MRSLVQIQVGPQSWMKNENLHVGGSFWTRSQALISPSRLTKSPPRAVWEDGRLPPSSWKSSHLRSFVDYAWLGQQDMSCITTERLGNSPAEAVSLTGIEGAGLVKVEKLDSGSGHLWPLVYWGGSGCGSRCGTSPSPPAWWAGRNRPGRDALKTAQPEGDRRERWPPAPEPRSPPTAPPPPRPPHRPPGCT